MPIYVFSHPKTREVKEVFMPINGDHTFIENGVEWNREYDFNVSVKSSPISPWKKNDFLQKTNDMRGNIGDIMDISQELSEKRAEQNGGVDPVKKKYFQEYSKLRKGRKHHEDVS